MKTYLFLFLTVTLSFSAKAFSATQRWVIHEDQPDSGVHVRVIEGSSTAPQGPVSQDVVFDKIMSADEFSHFDLNHAPLTAFVAPRAGKPLWLPKQPSWTVADEDAYSLWFAANANKNFLEGSNLKADCADTGLLFRWVYARNNGLPIANTLSGSGQLFGHFSSNAEWDQLAINDDWKKDERFKAALRYLFTNTYTRTVVSDLAPTLVTPEYVRAGSLFMIIRKSSGHTQLIQSVDLHAGLNSVWGNEPASGTIYESPLAVEFDQKETFGVWREPRQKNSGAWELIPADEMPGYSLEQFQQKFVDDDAFMSWIDSRLGIQITNQQRLTSLTLSLTVGVFQRLSVTAQGLFVCYFQSCSSSSQAYDDYSTTSRDNRLATTQAKIIALVTKLGTDDPDVQAWEETLNQRDAFIVGTNVTLRRLALDPTAMKSWNPDPRVSYAKRWGLNDTSASDPNFDFFMSMSVISQLLPPRVFNAANHLDTAVLDSQIRSIFTNAQKDRASQNFQPDSFEQIFSNLSRQKFSNGDTAVCEQGVCTYNDALWGPDGTTDQVSKWSSSATADFATRWGF